MTLHGGEKLYVTVDPDSYRLRMMSWVDKKTNKQISKPKLDLKFDPVEPEYAGHKIQWQGGLLDGPGQMNTMAQLEKMGVSFPTRTLRDPHFNPDIRVEVCIDVDEYGAKGTLTGISIEVANDTVGSLDADIFGTDAGQDIAW